VYNGRTLRTDEGNIVKRKEHVTLITQIAQKTFAPTVLQFHSKWQSDLITKNKKYFRL